MWYVVRVCHSRPHILHRDKLRRESRKILFLTNMRTAIGLLWAKSQKR